MEDNRADVGQTLTLGCACPTLIQSPFLDKLSPPFNEFSNTSNMEHRCGTRHSVDLLVYVSSHGGAVSSAGQLRCISVSGGFLYTTLPVQPLSRISLRLADSTGRLGAHLEGHVIRRSTNGLGIEWNHDVSHLLNRLIGPSLAKDPVPSSRGDRALDALL